MQPVPWEFKVIILKKSNVPPWITNQCCTCLQFHNIVLIHVLIILKFTTLHLLMLMVLLELLVGNVAAFYFYYCLNFASFFLSYTVYCCCLHFVFAVLRGMSQESLSNGVRSRITCTMHIQCLRQLSNGSRDIHFYRLFTTVTMQREFKDVISITAFLIFYEYLNLFYWVSFIMWSLVKIGFIIMSLFFAVYIHRNSDMVRC